MRLLLSFLLSLYAPAYADDAARFLDQLCVQGFQKTTMPKDESRRFCSCVRDEVVPKLTGPQRRLIGTAESDLKAGRHIAEDRFVSSGVRDLVVAGQASCQAAFYPPSAPINLKANALELTLRCEEETKTPEALIYLRGVKLLTRAELAAVDKRLMKADFEPEYAKVTVKVDANPARTDRWEIDLTGQIVSPPNSARLIEQLRTASSISVEVERGNIRSTGVFQVAGKIPARWLPCGGVSR